ncbi:hypothetical protein EYF80_020061 [Liparis tanakae]|uniref:Uncharacterized protein n=1 Tax=Liparis tanakae TaxID=230148 RepID=A0A4Z2HVH3_9TELE|nr:hypothetical protein EYF80_020061 [Liparis tanakae]
MELNGKRLFSDNDGLTEVKTGQQRSIRAKRDREHRREREEGEPDGALRGVGKETGQKIECGAKEVGTGDKWGQVVGNKENRERTSEAKRFLHSQLRPRERFNWCRRSPERRRVPDERSSRRKRQVT